MDPVLISKGPKPDPRLGPNSHRLTAGRHQDDELVVADGGRGPRAAVDAASVQQLGVYQGPVVQVLWTFLAPNLSQKGSQLLRRLPIL